MRHWKEIWDYVRLQAYMAISYPPDPDFSHLRIFYFGIPCVLKRNRFLVSTESDALRFLHSTGLGLPIPRLLDTLKVGGATWTLMSKVPGRTLMDLVWRKDITEEEVKAVVNDAALVIHKLQGIRLTDNPTFQQGKVMYSASGHGLPNPLDTDDWNLHGPLSITELYLEHAFANLCDDAPTWSLELLRSLEPERTEAVLNDKIVWVHCDLRATNIMVHKGRLSGVIDWENSGWMPRHWQLLVIRPTLGTQPQRVAKVWRGMKFDTDVELAYEAGYQLMKHYV